jgi:DnaJ-class molecular chaperone
MMVLADKQPPKQALLELQAILKKPYKDVCHVCRGEGKITNSSNCPKCKGSGQRLVRLL